MATSLRSRLLAQRALMQRLKQPQRRNPLQAGFTLIELLIVVIIIGILASIALPAFLNQRDKAEIEGAKAEARSFVNTCLGAYIADSSQDPSVNDPSGKSNTCPSGANFDSGTNYNYTSSTGRTATVTIGSGGSIEGITAQ